MSTYSTGLGNEVPRTIEVGDVTFHVSLIDQAMKGRIEQHLHDLAKQALRKSKDLYSEADYLTRVDKLTKLFEEGEFAMESERGIAFLKSQKGLLTLATLVFNSTEMDMVALMKDHEVEATEALKWVIDQSMVVRQAKKEPADLKPEVPPTPEGSKGVKVHG